MLPNDFFGDEACLGGRGRLVNRQALASVGDSSTVVLVRLLGSACVKDPIEGRLTV